MNQAVTSLCLLCISCASALLIRMQDWLYHSYTMCIRPYTIGGLYWWTRLVDWTTGLIDFHLKRTFRGSIMRCNGGNCSNCRNTQTLLVLLAPPINHAHYRGPKHRQNESSRMFGGFSLDWNDLFAADTSSSLLPQLWAVCWVAIGLETSRVPSLSSYKALLS